MAIEGVATGAGVGGAGACHCGVLAAVGSGLTGWRCQGNGSVVYAFCQQGLALFLVLLVDCLDFLVQLLVHLFEVLVSGLRLRGKLLYSLWRFTSDPFWSLGPIIVLQNSRF